MSLMVSSWPRIAILLGSPRSGTTWLAKIVDSHADVLYRHEPDSINVLATIPFVPTLDEAAANVGQSREYLISIMRERASKSSGSQPMFRKSYRSGLGDRIHRSLIIAVKGGERLFGNPRFLSRLQIPDLFREQAGQPLVFIKSVSSLCRAYMFSLAAPEMKFVHILRHPCAYVASTLRGKKMGLLSDDAYIETLACMAGAERYGLSLDVLRTMSREEQLAARWMLQNEKVMVEMDGSQRYLRVVYEDLCKEPQSVAEELFNYLGLDMTEQTRAFIRRSSIGIAEEIRYFDLHRDSNQAATGWVKELTTDQIERIRSVVSGSEPGRLYFYD